MSSTLRDNYLLNVECKNGLSLCTAFPIHSHALSSSSRTPPPTLRTRPHTQLASVAAAAVDALPIEDVRSDLAAGVSLAVAVDTPSAVAAVVQ